MLKIACRLDFILNFMLTSWLFFRQKRISIASSFSYCFYSNMCVCKSIKIYLFKYKQSKNQNLKNSYSSVGKWLKLIEWQHCSQHYRNFDGVYFFCDIVVSSFGRVSTESHPHQNDWWNVVNTCRFAADLTSMHVFIWMYNMLNIGKHNAHRCSSKK